MSPSSLSASPPRPRCCPHWRCRRPGREIDGGAVQGIGRAMTEEVVLRDDKIVNPSLITYLMPMAAEVPAIENILVQVPTEHGPFGARAVAEPPDPGQEKVSDTFSCPFGARAVAEPPGFGPPAAIANAIEDVVGVRLQELPLSAERMLQALPGEAPEAFAPEPTLLQLLRKP